MVVILLVPLVLRRHADRYDWFQQTHYITSLYTLDGVAQCHSLCVYTGEVSALFHSLYIYTGELKFSRPDNIFE